MPSTNDQLLARAVKAYREGDFAEAERHCRDALRAAPRRGATAWNLLGALYRRTSRWVEAKRCLEEALAIEPDNSAWLSNLGEIHRLGGELDCAEELFREAILKSPIYSKAYNNLGLTLHSKEQYYEAETVLRKAIELDPQNAAAENNLGNALYAQEKAEEAVSHYRQAIGIESKIREGIQRPRSRASTPR